MAAPTPLDQDGINPNFLTMLANLQTRVETLERQAASGLFDGDTMRPPGVLSVRGGNLEVIGNRSVHRAIFNLGPAVILTLDAEEITISQSYHKVAENGAPVVLSTINGGVDGDVLWLIADTGDTIEIVETGNISVQGADDTLIDSTWFLAIYNGDTSTWVAMQAF